MRLDDRWLILVLLGALPGLAQQPAPGKADAADKPLPTGSVTGRVYLSDTKAPARKATVCLQPAAAMTADAPPGRGQGR